MKKNIPWSAMSLAKKVEYLKELYTIFEKRANGIFDTTGDFDYWGISRRVTKLEFFVCRKKKYFDESDLHKWSLQWYLDEVRSKKEYGKKQFETKFRFYPWFMQTSLTADYGEYKCDICARLFYHSPSHIFMGKKEVAGCACGYCVNSYAAGNGQSKIFG